MLGTGSMAFLSVTYVNDLSQIDQIDPAGKLNAMQPEVSIASNSYIRPPRRSGKIGEAEGTGVARRQHFAANGRARLSGD